MRQWIVEHRERPFAYVQVYEAHAWLQAHLQHLPSGAQVMDVFVGEPDMLRCGLGSAFLRLLAGILIREGAPLVAIDPDFENHRARRAFANAGFTEDAIVEAKQGMVVLMVFGERCCPPTRLPVDRSNLAVDSCLVLATIPPWASTDAS